MGRQCRKSSFTAWRYWWRFFFSVLPKRRFIDELLFLGLFDFSPRCDSFVLLLTAENTLDRSFSGLLCFLRLRYSMASRATWRFYSCELSFWTWLGQSGTPREAKTPFIL